MLNINKLKNHIKKCKKKCIRFNFLGLVENEDLTPEVMSFFTFYTPSGFCGYDWVNGNEKLKNLINTI